MFTSTTITGSMRKTLSKKTQAPAKKKTDALPPNALQPQDPEVKLPETDGWLTRNEATDVLRCSPQTLKNYEHRDLLHPRHAVRRDRSGGDRTMLVYNPKELAELPFRNGGGQPRIAVRDPGEQAARAFELFRQDWDLDQVVIELRETPDRIDQLHEHWLDQTKARYVLTPEARKTLEQLIGDTFKSVTELVELLTKKLTA